MDRRVIASGGRRAARRRPPSVAWATVKVFDAASGAGGATRRAVDIHGEKARLARFRALRYVTLQKSRAKA